MSVDHSVRCLVSVSQAVRLLGLSVSHSYSQVTSVSQSVKELVSVILLEFQRLSDSALVHFVILKTPYEKKDFLVFLLPDGPLKTLLFVSIVS